MRKGNGQEITGGFCRLSGSRRHRADDRGDESPLPGPSTLFSVPGQRQTRRKGEGL